MLPVGLIDTGAVLAIVEDDYWHSACLEALQSVSIPLLTSEAVVTELFHLMEKNGDNIRSGGVVCDVTDSDLPTLR